MTITPDQAQELLDGATPGPWHKCRDNHSDCDCPEGTVFGPDVVGSDNPGIWWTTADEPVILAAPDMAETIAGMREEWKVQTRPRGLPWREWTPQEIDFGSEEEAFRYARKIHSSEPLNCRIVRRLVGPWEEVIDGE